MPNFELEGGITFFYTDSGPVASDDYVTHIVLHGHTFHSGIFSRLFPLAQVNNLRLICVNRREYPGTSPYSDEEIRIINEGTDDERSKLLREQGKLLALLVNGLIQTLSLPKRGGVAITGWSLGNSYVLAIMAALNHLPDDVKDRLSSDVNTFVLWDPPAQSLGIPDPPNSYVPFWDETLLPEARGPAFGKWCASYFKHGDVSSNDFGELNQRNPDESQKSTLDKMTMDEILSVADFVPGSKCETIWVSPAFVDVLANQTKVLFDPQVHKDWKGVTVWHPYGDMNSWIVLYAVQKLKQWAKPGEINFKVVEGANHFLMWEHPKKAVDLLKECKPV